MPIQCRHFPLQCTHTGTTKGPPLQTDTRNNPPPPPSAATASHFECAVLSHVALPLRKEARTIRAGVTPFPTPKSSPSLIPSVFSPNRECSSKVVIAFTVKICEAGVFGAYYMGGNEKQLIYLALLRYPARALVYGSQRFAVFRKLIFHDRCSSCAFHFCVRAATKTLHTFAFHGVRRVCVLCTSRIRNIPLLYELAFHAMRRARCLWTGRREILAFAFLFTKMPLAPVVSPMSRCQ